MVTRGALASLLPTLTGSRFGSPEMLKAMQDMAAAFEDGMTKAHFDPVHRFPLSHADRSRSSRHGRSFHRRNANFPVTLNHLDLFSYIGGFGRTGGMLVLGDRKLNPKTDYNGVFADPAAFAKNVRLL